MLEFRFALMLMADPEVVDIQDQPPAVRYRMPGETDYHLHTFDFLVTYRSGKRVYIECKAAEQVVKENIEEIVETIELHYMNGTADAAFVVDDDLVDLDMAENAEDIVEARKCRNDGDCLAVLEFMRKHHEPISMDDVCDAFVDAGWTRTALLNLIYDGLVEHLEPTMTFEDAPLVRTVFN